MVRGPRAPRPPPAPALPALPGEPTCWALHGRLAVSARLLLSGRRGPPDPSGDRCGVATCVLADARHSQAPWAWRAGARGPGRRPEASHTPGPSSRVPGPRTPALQRVGVLVLKTAPETRAPLLRAVRAPRRSAQSGARVPSQLAGRVSVRATRLRAGVEVLAPATGPGGPPPEAVPGATPCHVARNGQHVCCWAFGSKSLWTSRSVVAAGGGHPVGGDPGTGVREVPGWDKARLRDRNRI